MSKNFKFSLENIQIGLSVKMKVFVVVLCAIFGANGAPFASIDDNQVDGDLESIDLSQYGSSIYRIPSNETGYRVANYNPDDGMNPEELGDYLEGDMVMPHDFGRNGLIAASSHWPNGIVPFEINGDYCEYEQITGIRIFFESIGFSYIYIRNLQLLVK